MIDRTFELQQASAKNHPTRDGWGNRRSTAGYEAATTIHPADH